MPQLLTIKTAATSHSITPGDLKSFPASARIEDVSQIDPRRQGAGVRLVALFEHLQIPTDKIQSLRLKSSSDGFEKPISSASLPTIWETACLLYELNGQALSPEQGGPFRLFVPATVMCGTAELDNCTNIKFLDEIVVE